MLRSAANVQRTMHVGLGQSAEATRTVERLEKALKTLLSFERFAPDQHDHVSFAKAWDAVESGGRASPGPRFQVGPTVGDGPRAES